MKGEHLAQGILQQGLLFGFDREIDDGVLAVWTSVR
jgi:hypothetical protein